MGKKSKVVKSNISGIPVGFCLVHIYEEKYYLIKYDKIRIVNENTFGKFESFDEVIEYLSKEKGD